MSSEVATTKREKMQELLAKFENLENQRQTQNIDRLDGFKPTGEVNEGGYSIYSKKVNSIDDIEQAYTKKQKYISTLEELKKLNQELYNLVDGSDNQ